MILVLRGEELDDPRFSIQFKGMAMFVQQSPRQYLKKCLTCPVIQRGLCCDASLDAQRALSEASSCISYRPGEEIIEQGADEEGSVANFLFI